MTRLLSLLGAVAFLAASPLHAQEQTPENAHRFLTELSRQGLIKFTGPNWYFESVSTMYSRTQPVRIERSRYAFDPFPLSIVSSEGCKTTLTPMSVPVPGDPRQYPHDGLTDTDVDNAVFGIALNALTAAGIDWKKVGSLERHGNEISMPITDVGQYTLIFTTPEMATRAIFAMEVIKQSCDPAASTGF